MYIKVYVVLLLDDQENNFFVVVRTNWIPTSVFFWKLTLCQCRITNLRCLRSQKVDFICAAMEA